MLMKERFMLTAIPYFQTKWIGLMRNSTDRRHKFRHFQQNCDKLRKNSLSRQQDLCLLSLLEKPGANEWSCCDNTSWNILEYLLYSASSWYMSLFMILAGVRWPNTNKWWVGRTNEDTAIKSRDSSFTSQSSGPGFAACHLWWLVSGFVSSLISTLICFLEQFCFAGAGKKFKKYYRDWSILFRILCSDWLIEVDVSISNLMRTGWWQIVRW